MKTIKRRTPSKADQAQAVVVPRRRLVKPAAGSSGAVTGPSGDGTVYRHIALGDRRKGWPRLRGEVPDTMYRVEGVKVHGFVTDIGNGTLLGWDLCGQCAKHVTRCRCRMGVTPPRAVVYCYRSGHRMPYDPAVSGYIGFTHDPVTGESTGTYVESPVNRRRREAAQRGEDPDAGYLHAADQTPPTPPRRRVLKQRTPGTLTEGAPVARRRVVKKSPAAAEPPVPVRRVVRKKGGRK